MMPTREIHLGFIRYGRSIAKQKWTILVFAIMLASLTAAVVFSMTPFYRSTMTLLINAGKSKVLSIEDISSGLTDRNDYIVTQMEILRSPDILIKTIIRLKLWEYAEFDPREHTSLLRKMLVILGTEKQAPAAWTEETLAAAILDQFSAQLLVEPIRLSTLIKVSFESSDKILAAKVVNTMASVYIDTDMDVHFQTSQKASNWLQNRMESIRDKLHESEIRLQAYRDKEGIIDVQSASQGGTGRQFEEATQHLMSARVRLAEAQNTYNQVKFAENGADLSSLPAVIHNPVVGEALKQQAEAERNLAEIAQRYEKKHPKYVQAEGEFKTASANVKHQTDTVVASVTREYEVARGTVATLQLALEQARGSVQTMNRKEFQLNVLLREVEANKQIYELFSKRAKEMNVSGDFEAPVARIIDAGKPAIQIAKPQKLLLITEAFVLGLLGATVIAMLTDLLDTTLNTCADVESRLAPSVLTALPLLTGKKINDSLMATMLIHSPASLYAESIRTARAWILLSPMETACRIILITSSISGEGRTTIATNLALAHAQTKKTLLIDADMRHPALAKFLHLPNNTKGLSNLVTGTATLAECIHNIEGSPLAIITAGLLPKKPQELILSSHFKDLLGQLSRQFDIIVMDSPPAELVGDAITLAQLATELIFVVKAGSTPYPLAQRGLKRLVRAQGHMPGIVLNQLDFTKTEKYFGEYTGYNNGHYGAAYDNEKN